MKNTPFGCILFNGCDVVEFAFLGDWGGGVGGNCKN